MIQSVLTNPTMSKELVIEVYSNNEWRSTIKAERALEVLETIIEDDYYCGDAEDEEKIVAIMAALSALRAGVEQAGLRKPQPLIP